MKIVMSTLLALFLIGCSDVTENETKNSEVKQPAIKEIKKDVVEASKIPEVDDNSVKDENIKTQEYEKISVELISNEIKEVNTPAVSKEKKTVAKAVVKKQ